jgi:cation transport regulator ChaC
VATIVPENGAIVHGVLWRLSQPDVASLDRHEGVAEALYVAKTLPVQREEGRNMNAMVYLAADDQPGAPRPRYLGRIVAAALAHGFPQEYVRELRAWSARPG